MNMADPPAIILVDQIEPLILDVRGHKVLLDNDLATLYGTITKVLNQAVKRNRDRFPADFLFQLNASEKQEVVTICDHLTKLKFSPRLPYAFTEHGAIMAATILNSPRAVEVSVFVVRAFVKLRHLALTHKDLAAKLAELEQRVAGHDDAIRQLVAAIRQLMAPPAEEPPRRRIGFGRDRPSELSP
jgi:hypothetical protein